MEKNGPNCIDATVVAAKCEQYATVISEVLAYKFNITWCEKCHVENTMNMKKLNKVEGDAIKSLKVSRGERVFLGEIGEQQ